MIVTSFFFPSVAMVTVTLLIVIDRMQRKLSKSMVKGSLINDGLVRLAPDQPDTDLPARNESVWTTPSWLLRVSRFGSSEERLPEFIANTGDLACLIHRPRFGHYLYTDNTQLVDSVQIIHRWTACSCVSRTLRISTCACLKMNSQRTPKILRILCMKIVHRLTACSCVSRRLQLNPVKTEFVWYDFQS